MSKRKRSSDGGTIDMTPMIDVVFQLIIFFIVTITISEAKDEEVRLALGKHGETTIDEGENSSATALIIDIGPRGRVSVNNITLTEAGLQTIIRGRFARQGNSFQIWIRGDYRVPHSYVRRVMDICTAEGVGRVHFVAIQDPRTPESRERFGTRR